MSNEYLLNATIDIQSLFQDQFKVPITTATGKIDARRLSDDSFFNGTIWVATPTSFLMTKVSDANAPGWQRFLFDTTGFEKDEYVFNITDSSGNAKNVPQTFSATVGGYPQDIIDLIVITDGKVDSIAAEVTRILGLSHDNFVLDPDNYDESGRMTEGEARIYNSKTNAETDDGSTGLLFKYSVTSERTIQGFLSKFTQVRET